MADRTQLRVADHNDIADDDPFAELTRIMGFDPRQPVKPQVPAQPKAVVTDPVAEEGDFDIDLEKELMGEFGADAGDTAPVAEAHEPAFESAAAEAMDNDFAMSLDDDFHLDTAEVTYDDASASDIAAAAPSAKVAFDSGFDNAVASSLEGVSPFEDDQPMQDELAASLDQDFQFAEEAEEPRHAVGVAEVPAMAVEPAFDHEFDDMVAGSLEDELMLDDHAADDHYAAEAEVNYSEPVHAVANEVHTSSDQDFVGHFDEAMADVDMDFDSPADELAAVEAPVAHDLFVADASDELSGVTSEEALDDAFDLNFDDALAQEPTAPVVVAPVAVAAMAEPAMQAPVADGRSLEDELNALLGAMSARTAPVAKEPVMVQQPVAAPARPVDEPTDLVGDLDWNLDGSALDELHLQGSDGATGDVDFDDDAFDAALAKSLDSRDTAASRHDQADSMDWLTERSPQTEPTRSWSRVTPVPQQPTFAAQPMASVAPVAPAMVPAYRASEPVETVAYAAPVSVPQYRQSPRYEEMPDVETVDVPERVVALADDLDIPELHFEEDRPAGAGYDDLDAEFASLLTEMNTTDAAPAPARAVAYEDESYNAGFKPGYEQHGAEARTYAARPAEMPARAAAPSAYADAADGFDVDDLPGSQPVSQADDFTVDELDYDPELDEAMSVPGLAERGSVKPSRGRGFFIAAIVGAVAIAGGLGAFALSLGGKGGTEAPVIVKADNAPIKIKPENPGGTVVPNQDNKVYDAVAKGTKAAAPVQEKLVTDTEQPVDVAAKDQQSRVVDLSPAQSDGADAADGMQAAGGTQAAGDLAPAPKSEDRIAQVLQDAEKATNPDVVAVAPRKVRTMVVKSDGSLVPREDPAPVAPQVAAAEPVDPAPQHVAPSAQADADQTGTVPQASDQANADQPAKPVAAKPTAKAEAKAQSANTPAKVPLAPQRPSDQPVDVVGEVKPDQVASIDPATAAGGGSWSMQIASQPTVDSAQSSYQDLQRRYASVLSGRTANIVKAEIAGKGTFYRVRVPAQSRNDAINLCTSYKAAGGNCFVSR
ncbi:MAG: SPOR domain-containing protein [Mesorhizobium sp.]